MLMGACFGQHSLERNARNDEFAPEAEYWQFAAPSCLVRGISTQSKTATGVWHGVYFGLPAVWHSHVETSKFGLSPFISDDIAA
jgi:hypothetical protein